MTVPEVIASLIKSDDVLSTSALTSFLLHHRLLGPTDSPECQDLAKALHRIPDVAFPSA
jgi:hypothetical protein